MRKDQEQILIEFEDEFDLVSETSLRNDSGNLSAEAILEAVANNGLEGVVSFTRILVAEHQSEDITEDYAEILADYYLSEVGRWDIPSPVFDWLASNTSLATNCQLERAA